LNAAKNIPRGKNATDAAALRGWKYIRLAMLLTGTKDETQSAERIISDIGHIFDLTGRVYEVSVKLAIMKWKEERDEERKNNG